jgi:cytochrome c5
MRQIPKGEVHALTALLMGMKLAVDHPGLIALKEKMLGALEAKTSPQVTPALLSAAKSSAPIPVLEEGRKLYTTRCAECHDLEMVDSRSVSGWEKMVGSMSGRAHLNSEQQSRIVQYLTVALNGMQQ